VLKYDSKLVKAANLKASIRMFWDRFYGERVFRPNVGWINPRLNLVSFNHLKGV